VPLQQFFEGRDDAGDGQFGQTSAAAFWVPIAAFTMAWNAGLISLHDKYITATLPRRDMHLPWSR
jgi:hypothetical protein